MPGSRGTLHRVCTLNEAHGPGLRFVAFLRGCPLGCTACVQPAWRAHGGRQIEAAALVRQAARYRPYFGQTGGITLAGAEPLAQVEFCQEMARAARQRGIHLCLETTGYRFDPQTRALYERVDLVLLHLPMLMKTEPMGDSDKPLEGLRHALAYFAQTDQPLWIRCRAGHAPEQHPLWDTLQKLRILRWEKTTLWHGAPVGERELP